MLAHLLPPPQLFRSHLHLLLSGRNSFQTHDLRKPSENLKPLCKSAACFRFFYSSAFAFAFSVLLLACRFHLSPKTPQTNKQKIKFTHIPPWHLDISWMKEMCLCCLCEFLSFILHDIALATPSASALPSPSQTCHLPARRSSPSRPFKTALQEKAFCRCGSRMVTPLPCTA